MKYPLVDKAYRVGSPEAISRFKTYGHNAPEDLIGVTYADTPGKAKYQFREVDYHDFTSLRCVRSPDEDRYLFEGKPITKSDIERKIKHREWRDSLSQLAKEQPELPVHIWSGQWGSYWGPNSAGYTSHVDRAGVYTAKEAWSNVSHCGPEKLIELRPVEQASNKTLSVMA